MDVNGRVIRPVIDPALAPLTQWWLKRLIARRASPGSRLGVERIGPIATGACALGAMVDGLASAWLFGAAAFGTGTLALRHEVISGGLRRHRDDFVDSRVLDALGVASLGAAQCAIDEVLLSNVYGEGQLDHAANAADLRQHEWEIACRLREIAVQRADHARNSSDGIPGPQTQAVLDAHQRALAIAQQATTRRVAELQRYATVVLAADAALRDWRTAEQVASKNHRYLELVARSAADDHAVAEIVSLTERAIHTRDTYRSVLDQAVLAAQPLALPATERRDPVAGQLDGDS